jgi:cytochrome b561
MDQQHQLSKTSVVLHWAVALVIIGLSIIGLLMSAKEIWFLYPIHKSIGTLIFALILVRAIWRVRQSWPKPVRSYAGFEQVLSKLVHWILIVGSVLMPVSGMLMSGAGGHGIALFGWELMAEHHSLTQPNQVLPYSEFWASVGENGHTLIGYIMIAAIALHAVGALKHHIIDRDGTLRRMLGQNVSGQ